MRNFICLTMTLCMLFTCVPSLAQETPEQQAPEQGIPVDGDITEVPADMIEALEAAADANAEKVRAEGETEDGLSLQEKEGFGGFIDSRSSGVLSINVTVSSNVVKVGEKVTIRVEYDTLYTPVYIVHQQLIYNSAFAQTGETKYVSSSTRYSNSAWTWSHTPQSSGYFTFLFVIEDGVGNQIVYSTPTIKVETIAVKEPYKGIVDNDGAGVLIEMDKAYASVGEPITATCMFWGNTGASVIYVGGWAAYDRDDNEIDRTQWEGVLSPDQQDQLYDIPYTPQEPGELRFLIVASDSTGKEFTISSPMITVYPYIEVYIDQEISAMFGDTVTAVYDVEWPDKSPYLQGYWTFTDENGKSSNKWVTVSSGGGTVSYTTDKPGTLKFTVIATLNGKEYKYTTEEITVEPYNISVWLDKSSVAFGDEVTAHYSVDWYGEDPMVEACWKIEADDFTMNTWEEVESLTGSFTYTPEYGNRVRFYVHAIVGEEKVWEYSSYCDFTGTPLRDDPVYVKNVSINQTSATIGKTITGSYSLGNYTGSEDAWYYVEWQVYADGERYDYTYYDDELPGPSGTVSFTPSFGDEVRLYVYAYDKDFWVYKACATLPITGTPLFDPPRISLQLDKTSVNTGENLTATYSVTGGPEDMEVDLVWYHVNEEESEWSTIKDEFNISKSGTSTLIVPYGPMIECDVSVSHELLPAGVSKSVSVPVYGEPAYGINLSLDKTTVMTGEYVTATYECVGYPDGDVSINWYFYDENEDRISIVYAEDDGGLSGTSTVYVPFGRKLVCNAYLYHDTLPSAEEYKSIPITGYPLYDPLEITASLDKTTVQSGSPLTLTYSVTGGKAPLDVTLYASTNTADYSGYWTIASRYDLPASGKEVVIPYLGDEVDISLYVTDADGNSASWYVWEQYSGITITGAPEAQETRLTVTADKTEVIVGEPITVTYNFSTGNVPLGEGCYYYWSVSDQDGDGYGELLEEGEITEKSGTFTYVPEDYAGATLYFGMYICNVYGQYHYNWDIEAAIVNDPSRLPGDADDNGSVDIYDALTILKHLSGEAVDINLTNAEVNRDNQVNVQDAMLIMEKSAGWNVKLK